jgi:succinyl-CoA synthetase alpha subunit
MGDCPGAHFSVSLLRLQGQPSIFLVSRLLTVSYLSGYSIDRSNCMNLTTASQVLVQGIMEPLGQNFAPRMKDYGSNIVAGIAPGYGGACLGDIPLFDMVEQVVAAVGAIDVSVICTHPYGVLDAALEAMHGGVRQLVLVTQGVPPLDMVELIRRAEMTETLVLGPNSPGLIMPGKLLLGVHPPGYYAPGRLGMVTRNGPLTYEVAYALTQEGLGQSICVSIGSDAVLGSTFQQWLQILDEDEGTDVIVLAGEIGGDNEEAAAQYILESIEKPVIAYIAGHRAPKDRRLGHAGAIIASQLADLGLELGTAESKVAAFGRAGVPVARRPWEIGKLVRRALKGGMRRSA